MLDEGVPRWFGKQLYNELINMPRGEQRRISQILTEETKRKALKECLVPGNHKGSIIEGHSIQRAVMRRLASESEVVAFVDFPVETNRLRKFPCPIPISHAFTGYFTC